MKNRISSTPTLAALIVENAVEYAIFTMTAEGSITSWNPGAERIFGYSPPEVIGLHFAVLFTDSDVETGIPDAELRRTIQDGRAEDTRWHRRRNGEHFWANGVTMPITESGGGAGEFLKIIRDETPAKLAEDQRVLLLNELNHRLKNTMAIVQSLAEQTLRGNVPAEVREDFVRRLMALSEAHNVLVTENWAGADLAVIIATSLTPFKASGANTFVLEGPSIRLSPQQAVTFSMAIHELATNASKHGALTVPSGRINVTWNLSHDAQGRRSVTFLWVESEGPPVTPPRRRGFGSQMLRNVFERSGGKFRLDFLPAGLRCAGEFPLPDSGRVSLQG